MPNAVVPIKGQDAYLVNFRYQSAVIKVNKKKWRSNGFLPKIPDGERI